MEEQLLHWYCLSLDRQSRACPALAIITVAEAVLEVLHGVQPQRIAAVGLHASVIVDKPLLSGTLFCGAAMIGKIMILSVHANLLA